MKSIRTKILIIICSLLIIAVGLLGSTVSLMMYNNSISSLEQTMTESTKIAQELVVSRLDEFKAISTETGLIARLSSVDSSIEQKQRIIDDKIKEHPELLFGNVVDINGNGVLNSTSVGDRDYFKKAIAGEANVSDLVESRTLNGKWVITIAAPLWENGLYGTNIVGAVYYLLDANFLSDAIKDISIGKIGSAYMIDKNNYTIAHKTIKIEERDNTIQALNSNPELKELASLEAKMTAGESGFGIYTYKCVKKILTYAPVDNGLGWSIAINADYNEFTNATTIAIFVTFGIALVVVIAGIIISFIFSNSISRPLKEVGKAMEAVATGEFDNIKLTHTSKDELGNLANEIRTTIKKITFIIKDLSLNLNAISKGDFTAASEDESAYVVTYKDLIDSTKK